MIILCEDLSNRLNKAWADLQRAIQESFPGSLSQVELDEMCVQQIEEWVQDSTTQDMSNMSLEDLLNIVSNPSSVQERIYEAAKDEIARRLGYRREMEGGQVRYVK